MKRHTFLLISVLCAWLFGGLAPVPVAHAQAGELLGRINNLRASLGLHPYNLNGALTAAAQSHANWMAVTKQISHNQPGGSTPTTRANAAGYGGWVSENIYGGTGASLEGAWAFWLNSPIHYRGMTNANYYDIGIASATADGWTFYVLKFGNASGSWGGVAIPTTGGGGGAGVARAPTFIVGWDNEGNIMHEIQEGQTIGDIALTYGYTWDDIPVMLNLNEMSDEDMRRLPIGGIFLVPPKGGTYTPTPYPEGYSSPTPNPDQAIETAIARAIVQETAAFATQRSSILLTPIFTPAPRQTDETQAEPPTDTPRRVATSDSVPVALQPTSDDTEPTPTISATPTPEATLTATLPEGTPIAQVFTPADTPPAPTLNIQGGQQSSPWLVVGVLLLASIFFTASAIFFMRSR